MVDPDVCMITILTRKLNIFILGIRRIKIQDAREQPKRA